MDYHLFLPMLIAFLITVLISPAFIPLLRKLKFGQYVREDGPESHLKKAGTPTMGGIVMILAFGITCIPYMFREPKLFPIFFLAMGFGVIGLLDDGIKILMKHSEGLLPWQKLGLQFLVTILFLVFLRKSGVDTQILIPFTHGQMTVDLGIMYYPLAFIAILGTVNGANFTDGLDGLGAGVTEWITIFFMVIGFIICKSLLPIAETAGVDGGSAVVVAAFTLLGVLAGFLIFNTYPARVFMGDTGSLFLGGCIAAMAFVLRMPLFIPIVAFIYLLEIVSVMIQVSYFKITHGKRFFKMAPIHHHFELSGWEETRVVSLFRVTTLILAVIGLIAA